MGKGSPRQGKEHVQRPGAKAEHAHPQTQWTEVVGTRETRAWTSASRAVTQGLDFEASRVGLGQGRGGNLRKCWANSGLLAGAGNVGRGVRLGVEGLVVMSLALASPGLREVTVKVSSTADLLNFPGREEHLPAAPPPSNILGRKERDLFCQRSL